jgi:ubiquinone/menaquinone biosynthesis C-methylase UbiE
VDAAKPDDEAGGMTDQAYSLSADAAEAYESTFVPALFREWALRLVEFAGVSAGSARSVLDVACGTGIVARTVADRSVARARSSAWTPIRRC